MSAMDSAALWDLRCEVREKVIAFIQSEFPGALPHRRLEVHVEIPETRLQGMNSVHPEGNTSKHSSPIPNSVTRRDQ